ncbi:MAG: DNA polymerase I [Lachnospirales bacterium]
MNKILIIDGNSILNRGYYGVPILTNSEGVYTNGVFGFLNIMFKFLDEVKPTHLCVAFDMPKPTFRHNMFSEYKGTRKTPPKELIPQFQLIREVLEKMTIKYFELEGYEADDILGTISKELEGDFDVTILSGDKDTLQLASNKTTIMIPKTSKQVTTVETYDYNKVVEVYGVTPTEFIDVKALMGDVSDNIPGVTGIGEKGALKIINEYKSIEDAIKNYEKVTPKKASENLNLERENALLSKTLATINREVPLKYSMEDLVIKDFFNEEAIDEFIRLGFKSFLPKSDKTEKVEYDIKTLDDFANLIKGIKKVGIFTFIFKEEFKIAFVINNKCYFVQYDDFKDLFIVLSNILEDEKVLKVFFDYKEFYMYSLKKGLSCNTTNFFDSSVAMYVINPLIKEYSIEELSWSFFSKEITSLKNILGTGKNKIEFESLSEGEVYNFLAIRSILNFNAYEVLVDKLKESNQEELFYAVEQPLIRVLGNMEVYGIKVDVDNIVDFGKDLDITIDELTKEIYFLADEEFNINSPSQLGVILFEKLGLKGGKKTKTGYSTGADVLEKIKFYHPIIDKVLQYRTVTKLKSTYVNGLLECVCEDDKIHSEFQQKVTATGRISSTNPNMQNLPIRSDLGRNLRKGFIPCSDEYCFVAGDYSQIELRVLAHLSEDSVLIDAFNNNVDIHSLTASEVFHCDLNEVTREQRSNAKAVNFGIVYGISSFSLSEDIKVTKKEADIYIEKYFNTYKGIKKYLENIVISAEDLGYSTTILNRVRPIPELKASNFIQRSFGKRIAMNTPIQGSAADIIKIAMINVNKALEDKNLKSRLILQIHDELIVETLKSEKDVVINLLRDEMEKALKLKVKLDVDINFGDSMYELK